MTHARLGQDVRWYQHDSRDPARQRVRELLAQPLDARSAVQIALLNNPGLQATFEELGVARAQLAHALAIPNPTVEAALRFRGSDPSGSDSPNIDLQAMEDLSALLFLPLRNGAAQAQLDVAKAEVAAQVLDLAFSVKVAFLSYQAATQGLQLRRTVLDATQASFDAAKRLHDAGNIPDLSLAKEQALYEETRLAFAAEQAAVLAAREQLNALLALPPETKWSVQPAMPEPSPVTSLLDNLEQRALAQSLDLQLLRQRVAAAEKQASVASWRGWIPEIKAGVSAERGEGRWGVGPAAAVELPIFYQGQGESGAFEAEARRAEQQHVDAVSRVRAAARAAMVQLKTASESVKLYKETVLPLREQILSETLLEYNAMGAGLFELLQAKRDQITASQSYVELLRDYWVARARVEQLLAGRLPAAN
jgi:cobalt-zinc-cadmium efflux system outer membrane protein